ncbi:UNVERIFIED_CONTAM: hypothetical protein Sangu_0337300 [Sesamum angustifolium]|uniref:Uncharacterized protein n=1 Tax=Sesamum angustifolium TaxID=2727405 RepID=A0AAW2QRB8_9LAMI
MAACGGLEHIFEKPLPESPRILEPLSPWKQIQPINTVNHSSFTEIYNAFFRQNRANDHPDSPTYSFSPFSPPRTCLPIPCSPPMIMWSISPRTAKTEAQAFVGRKIHPVIACQGSTSNTCTGIETAFHP